MQKSATAPGPDLPRRDTIGSRDSRGDTDGPGAVRNSLLFSLRYSKSNSTDRNTALLTISKSSRSAGLAPALRNEMTSSRSVQEKETRSFRPSVILRKAECNGRSNGVPLYCASAFCATKSAVISPSETSMFGNPVTGFRVIEAKPQRIVFDRQPKAVTHEIDVPLNGLGRDFELLGDFSAIWKMPVLQTRHGSASSARAADGKNRRPAALDRLAASSFCSNGSAGRSIDARLAPQTRPARARLQGRSPSPK